jgi:hypothetical protein
MLEWCQRLAAHGWHAGFLNTKIATESPAALQTLLKGLAPRFIVLDYAEQEPAAAQRLIEELSERKSGPKVRLMLLTRRVPDWWWKLHRRSEELDDLLAAEVSPEPLHLPPLFSPGPVRVSALSAAIRVFSDILGKKPPAETSDVDLSQPLFNNALFLYMQALSIVYGDAPEQRHDILEAILTHERRFWQKEIESLGLGRIKREALEDAIGPAIAAITLLEEVPASREAQRLVESLTGSALKAFDLTPTLLWVLKRFLGNGDDSFSSLQPDLLGEQLIESTLKEPSGEVGSTLLTRVFDGSSDSRALLNLVKTAMRLLLRRGASADSAVPGGPLEHRLQWLPLRDTEL